MKSDTYIKLGASVEYLKEKKKEALEEYLLLIKQMEQLQDALYLSAKKIAKFEMRYNKDFKKYSEAHQEQIKSGI